MQLPGLEQGAPQQWMPLPVPAMYCVITCHPTTRPPSDPVATPAPFGCMLHGSLQSNLARGCGIKGRKWDVALLKHTSIFFLLPPLFTNKKQLGQLD